jgi:hypothetical protein
VVHAQDREEERDRHRPDEQADGPEDREAADQREEDDRAVDLEAAPDQQGLHEVVHEANDDDPPRGEEHGHVRVPGHEQQQRREQTDDRGADRRDEGDEERDEGEEDRTRNLRDQKADQRGHRLHGRRDRGRGDHREGHLPERREQLQRLPPAQRRDAV